MLHGLAPIVAGRLGYGFLTPHSLHSDLGVLQAGPGPLCFAGAGLPGELVTVTVERDRDGASPAAVVARAGPAAIPPGGLFRVCARTTTPLGPSAQNHTVRWRAEPSGTTAVNLGVLLGTVVVCSGQSNMEVPTSYAFNGTAEIAAATRLDNTIRL